MRILLVEDERRLAEALEQILKRHGYLVDVTGDGTAGLDMAETGIYDVIVLDRMLPNMEGVEILRHLRANRVKPPVIFLTAKDSVPNRVEGLDAGADDYLVKPFSTDELLARVRALARRPENLREADALFVASRHLDMSVSEAAVNDEKIALSATEAQLLELLMRNRGQTLTKGQILDRIWGFGKDVDMKNVELYIFYLRREIPFDKSGVEIRTIRGVGYCLEETRPRP